MDAATRALRKALDPEFDESPVATVPRRGCQFTAEVRADDAAPATPAARAKAARRRAGDTIEALELARRWSQLS